MWVFGKYQQILWIQCVSALFHLPSIVLQKSHKSSTNPSPRSFAAETAWPWNQGVQGVVYKGKTRNHRYFHGLYHLSMVYYWGWYTIVSLTLMEQTASFFHQCFCNVHFVCLINNGGIDTNLGKL